MDEKENIAYIVVAGLGLVTYRVKLADGSAETFESLGRWLSILPRRTP